MKKRGISMLLIVCMLVSLIPPQAMAQQEPAKTVNPYTDVSEKAWYYENVLYALKNGLFEGISDNMFDPNGTMTRSMYVTVMGRIAEIKPEDYKGKSYFKDVNPDVWYAPFTSWAKEKNITDGVGDGEFLPDALITREQMAVMTVRFFESYGITLKNKTTDTQPNDLSSVTDFAKDAVLKLWQYGFFKGDEGGNFNPKNNASRAEAAAFLGRTDKRVESWFVETGIKKPSDKDRLESTTYYIFKFDTNDGTSISDRNIAEGDKLDNLPTPYKAGAIFVGWCYDKELEKLVSSSDEAVQSAILYAKWEETAPLTETEYIPVAISIDSDKNFTVGIISSEDMSIEKLRESIELKNLSSNENKEWFNITKSGNIFTVSGVNYSGELGAQMPGFVEGSAYKIILNNDALTFANEDVSARIYDFTIKREEIVNVGLDANVKDVSINDISNLVVNGKPSSEITLPIITLGADGKALDTGITKGSFNYTKGELQVGDSVMIYEGDTVPVIDMENAIGTGGNAFVEITAKDGTGYSYKTADAEDVLFTPDVLPLSENADTDNDRENNSVTVPVYTMTYTDDRFALAGLDSQTTIDVGDFIAFYSGTLKDDGTVEGGQTERYGEILSVELKDESYVIEYKDVTLDELQKAMAASKKENMDGEALLKDVDKKEIERNVEKQARDSGFADEAGMYLASLALETDSFTKISDDYELKTFEMQMNGQPITQETLKMMGADKKVEVELSKLQANLGTKLVHFEGISGLRLTLDIGVKITIHSAKADIEIEVTGSFEQEVRVDLGVDGDAVWKWWGIFPYIAEYKVTAFAEFYTYTGIGIEATIVTKEKDDEEGFGTKNEEIEKIGKQIKDLMDKKEKFIGDGSGTVSDSLEQKYADMLENESDWVELFEKSITKQDTWVLLIINITFEVKFVVTANMNISIGFDFWYENAKRYIYTVEIFAKNVQNEVIDLVEEHYEFEFYVMGTMGLRAGIKLELKVGLFSTDLASVGFGAEAGVYARLWGYFYYQLVYTASMGKSSSYSGALLLEIGAYLEITFEAQAFKGTFKYNPTLYENEWPFWGVGVKENVRDYAYEQEEVPNIKLKSYINSTRVPDSLFEMAYLDLKEGLDDGEYFTALYDDSKNFKITMTNPAFKYDTATNVLTVDTTKGPKQVGEMVLTWINQPLAFSSAPLERRIPLYWDNLRDGYVIVPYTNGGSYIPIMVKKFEENIIEPENPVKQGYVFAGWFKNKDLTQAFAFPKTMPNADNNIYAKWDPAQNTAYTVRHYKQKLGTSEYELADTDKLYGVTDSTVTPFTKSYEGFITPKQKQIVILPDGSAVLNYYYDLQTHKVTFKPGEVGGNEEVIQLKYGSTITAPKFGAKGYVFKSWDKEIKSHMGEEDLTYTAIWEKDEATQYRVEYYVQQPDGRFMVQDIEIKEGRTGEIITTENLRKDSLYATENISYFHNITIKGEAKDSAVIAGDGSTVIKVNYGRKQYTVTFKPQNDSGDIVYTLYTGAKIVAPSVYKLGYDFSTWGKVLGTIGTENLVYTAVWTARKDTGYKIKHVREDLEGNYSADGKLSETENKDDGVTGEKTKAQAKTYVGFTADVIKQETIAPDGSTVVEIKYGRNEYLVNWIVDKTVTTEKVKFEAVIAPPQTPLKQGYVFEKWNGYSKGMQMGILEQSFSAVWAPATDTPYKVKHLYEDLEGKFTIVEEEERKGVTEQNTSAAAKNKAGFKAKGFKQAKILPDGSTAVEIYYERNSYNISWMANNAEYTVTEAKFEEAVNLPKGMPINKIGYTFKEWLNVPSKMPAKDIAIEADWTANKYSVGLDGNGGEAPEDITVTYDSPYGTMPSATYVGYNFTGWFTEKDGGVRVTEGDIVKNVVKITLYAHWAPATDTKYTVNHMGADLEGEYTKLLKTEELKGTTDSETNAKGMAFDGFKGSAPITQESIANDGTTVVQVNYPRASFEVSWLANGQEHEKSTFLFEESIEPPITEPTNKIGYTFKEWLSVPINMPAKNISVVADWTANTYTVSFDGNGGNDPSDIEVVYDSPYGTLPIPLRTGYTFEKWLKDSVAIEESTKVTTPEPHTLTASWSADTDIPYTVEHYLQRLDGGYDKQEETTVQKGETGTDTDATAKTFEGFAVNSELTENTEILGDGTSVAKLYYDRVSYNAVWTAESYKETTVQRYEDKIALPLTLPQKQGYSLSWEGFSEDMTMPAKDISFAAKWTANKYNVSFNSMGGQDVLSGAYTYDSQYGTLPTPLLRGYTFVSWYTDETLETAVNGSTVMSIAEDHILYAKWSPNTDTEYTVHHYWQDTKENTYALHFTEKLQGTTDTLTDAQAKEYEGFTPKSNTQINIKGDGSSSAEIYYDRNTNSIVWDINGKETTEEYRYGAVITEPKAERAGYSFAGWDKAVLAAMPDNDLKYTAKWEVNTYTVSFDSAGGSDVSSIEVLYDSQYPVFDTPIRTGYDFKGWFNGEEEITADSIVKITSNTVFKAKWEAKIYGVSFDNNGGTGAAPQSINVKYGSAYGELPQCTAVMEGYSFIGWYTAQSGGTLVESTTSVSTANDHTLYARWKVNKYTIKFDVNGGSTAADITEDYGTVVTLPIITKQGYTHTGWKSGDTVYKPNSQVQMPENGITLTAQWSINRYTITFNPNGGTEVDSITADYGTKITAPNAPLKQGYEFEVWKTKNQEDFDFETIITDNLELTASYKPKVYAISYKNTEGVSNTNALSYTIESDGISLSDLSGRSGYSFMGWYANQSLNEESRISGIAIANGSTGDKVFYAKWEPVKFGINFNNNLKNNKTTSQTFTYDQSQALNSIASMGSDFTNNGYSFTGWNTEANGKGISYQDGMSVKNLVGITLYAQWKPISYTISYSLGAGGSSHSNPTTYNIESSDIYLRNPSNYSGYKFVGWFNTATNTKVSVIQKGSTGAIRLEARWEHGGIFSLSYIGTQGGTSTYRITRTIPSGASATSDAQNVYYRTVNGTAIGGSAEAVHFSHVGGENVFAVFYQNDREKTFTVKNENATPTYRHTGNGSYTATAYTNGTNRYYSVELYKIVNNVNSGYSGTINSSGRSIMRYIGTGNLIPQKGFYGYTSFQRGEEEKNITDGDDNGSHIFDISEYVVGGASYTTYLDYFTQTKSTLSFQYKLNIREVYDGYQFISFMEKDISKLRLYGSIKMEHGGSGVNKNYSTYTFGPYNNIPLTSKGMWVVYGAEGSGRDDWKAKYPCFMYKVSDTVEPQQIGLAPLAYGKYKYGDTISLSVVYDEVVMNRNGASLNLISGLNISNITYKGGEGTNVLNYTATLTSDFEVGDNTNQSLMSQKPVNKTVYDIAD